MLDELKGMVRRVETRQPDRTGAEHAFLLERGAALIAAVELAESCHSVHDEDGGGNVFADYLCDGDKFDAYRAAKAANE